MHAYEGDMHNTAHFEGCVTEVYIRNECLTLYSRYLTMRETKLNHLGCNDVEEVNLPHRLSVFGKEGKPTRKESFKQLSVQYRNWLNFMS